MKPSWQSRLLNFLLRIFVRRRFKVTENPQDARVTALKLLARFDRGHAADFDSAQLGQVDAKKYSVGGTAADKVILYLPGGGFYLPAADVHYQFVKNLSKALQADSFVTNYRLVPEHPFPTAPADCLASYQAILDLGYLPENICLAGDSAGGNLCLTTLMQARDKGLAMPACAVLLSPATDTHFQGSAVYLNAYKDPMFSVPQMFWMRDHYMGGAPLDDSIASPLLGDFSGLPPLMFHVGSTELLLDGSRLADRKARAQGVTSVLRVWEQQPHVFPLVYYLPEAKQATQEIIQFIDNNWSVS